MVGREGAGRFISIASLSKRRSANATGRATQTVAAAVSGRLIALQRNRFTVCETAPRASSVHTDQRFVYRPATRVLRFICRNAFVSSSIRFVWKQNIKYKSTYHHGILLWSLWPPNGLLQVFLNLPLFDDSEQISLQHRKNCRQNYSRSNV